MIKKLFAFFLCLFVFLYLFSQKAVYRLPITAEVSITNPTFFYTLPKTALKVDAVITKTSNMKGLYADFAEKLLGITNFCKENTTSYALKNIAVTPLPVPDETLQFVVELSAAQMKKNFLPSLYENNRVAGSYAVAEQEENNRDILPDFFKNYADVMMQHSYETYTETKIIDGVVTQVPVTQTKITSKTLAQQAQEAAGFIEKIRDDRYAVISFAQEITLSKEAFEYLVNQLDELEKKYLELFMGITVVEDILETFVIFPDHESALQPVCSVTPDSGFSPSMCATYSYNYYLRCTPQTSTNLQTDFYEALAANPKYKKNTGYAIRKAAPVTVKLVHGDTEEMLGIFPIYQYGLLETLPANLDHFEIGKWGFIY